jgi:hypothetical protein
MILSQDGSDYTKISIHGRTDKEPNHLRQRHSPLNYGTYVDVPYKDKDFKSAATAERYTGLFCFCVVQHRGAECMYTVQRIRCQCIYTMHGSTVSVCAMSKEAKSKCICCGEGSALRQDYQFKGSRPDHYHECITTVYCTVH